MPRRCSSSISLGTMTPPPPPKIRTWPAPRSSSSSPQVGEVLDVAALVAGDRDSLGVLLHGGGDDLGDAAVVAEVDDLGARGLQDAAA